MGEALNQNFRYIIPNCYIAMYLILGKRETLFLYNNSRTSSIKENTS